MADFSEALIVPALISTVRKIQHDSDDALRVLASFRNRCVAGGYPGLGTAEKAAIQDILENVARQGSDALMFFIFALVAVKTGGAIGGQSAQALISINYMTAPKKQFLKPREWLFYSLGIRHSTIGKTLLRSVPEQFLRNIAFSLGGLGKLTGYEPRNVCTA